MTKTLYIAIVAVFAYGCTTAINASEIEVSAREDAREAALWTIMTTARNTTR